MHKRTSTLSAAARSRRPALSRSALVLLTVLTACAADAAPYTYTGGGTGTAAAPITGNFSNGFNDGTNSNVSPPANDNATALYFGGSSTYTATNNLSTLNLNSLNFTNSGAVTLAASSYSLNLGGTTPTVNLNNTGSVAINQSLSLTTNTTFTGSGSAVVGGVISGIGNGLTLGSSASPFTGILSLVSSNSYTGATVINGGMLSISTLTATTVNNGIGKSSNVAGNLVLNGGTLQFMGASSGANGTTDRLFTLGAKGGTLDASGSVAVNFSNTGSIAFSSVNQSQALVLTGTNTGNNTLATKITDNGSGLTSLTKNGTGTWVLTGTNTYSGGTTVNGGTLNANVSNAVGTGGLAINNTNMGAGTGVLINFNASQSVSSLSSTVATASSGTNTAQINIASSTTLTDTQSGTTNYAGSITGAGTLNIAGQGTGSGSGLVNYTGNDSAAQTYVGANATLQLNNSSGPALSGPVAVATSGTLTISPNGTNNEIATATPPTASPTVAAVTLNGGTLNANGSDGAISDPTHLATTSVTKSMGALALGSGGARLTPSLLNFGSGGTVGNPFVLAFADSSITLGTGYLNVTGYTGTTNALYIGTTQSLNATQLNQIAFNGIYGLAGQLGNGQITLSPTPEPSGFVASLLGAGGLAGLVFLRRRRTARVA